MATTPILASEARPLSGAPALPDPPAATPVENVVASAAAALARAAHAGETASRAALGALRARSVTPEADQHDEDDEDRNRLANAALTADLNAASITLAPVAAPDPSTLRFQNQRVTASDLFGWTDSRADSRADSNAAQVAHVAPARRSGTAQAEERKAEAEPIGEAAPQDERTVYLAMVAVGAAVITLRPAAVSGGAALRMVKPRSRIECLHRCGAHGLCEPDSANGCGGTWCGQAGNRV